jgi:hypothetical protein
VYLTEDVRRDGCSQTSAVLYLVEQRFPCLMFRVASQDEGLPSAGGTSPAEPTEAAARGLLSLLEMLRMAAPWHTGEQDERRA